jgi:allophanate hydrolase
VAERTSALRERVTRRPDTLHPVTRAILESGLHRLAVDAFDDFHAAAEARLVARDILAGADALLLPTCPGVPTLAAMAADPVGANSRLGRYTNFVNLCDLAALAIPLGRPGVTLVGPAFSEARLAGLGAALLGEALPKAPLAEDEIALFCIGAHMSSLPLNHQVLGHGGRFLRAAATAPEYRLFSLGNRPGLVRAAGGGAIAGEVWALPASEIGPFLASIPPPLGFGRVTLADGDSILGFLAESAGVADAPEITALGGWRAHLAAQ